MDPQLQQLNTDLEAAVAEVKSLAAKSDATQEQIDAAQAKMNALKSRILAYKSANEVDNWQNATPAAKSGGTVPATARDTTPVPQPGAEAKNSKGTVGQSQFDLMTGEVIDETGIGVLSQQQVKHLTNPEYKSGFTNWLRAEGNEAKMRGSKSANDAFLEGREEEGAHLVPIEVVSGIIRREPTPTRIVDRVRTLAITRGDKVQMVRANYDTDDLYSSAVRVYKVGEASAAKKTDKPQFGLKSVDVHGWTAEISISKWLLADTNYDLMGYFTEEFRTAIRNMRAQKVLFGSGVGEHFGIFTRASAAKNGIEVVKSGDAANLTWDSLRRIKNKVPEQYDTNCRYYFNKRSTLDAIEGFKDDNGRDLWPESQRAGGVAGAPGTLRGYGYDLEAFMHDIAPGKFPLLFGDAMGYGVALRAGMTVQVLREIEARNGQVVFLVDYREGGDVLEEWRLKALQIAA